MTGRGRFPVDLCRPLGKKRRLAVSRALLPLTRMRVSTRLLPSSRHQLLTSSRSSPYPLQARVEHKTRSSSGKATKGAPSHRLLSLAHSPSSLAREKIARAQATVISEELPPKDRLECECSVRLSGMPAHRCKIMSQSSTLEVCGTTSHDFMTRPASPAADVSVRRTEMWRPEA